MAYVEGAYNIASGKCSYAEGSSNVANNVEIDSWEQMANALYKLNMNVKDAASAIESLQQTLYNQLGAASSVITENPNQKSDLEISSRIVVNPDFEKLIDLYNKL